MKGKFIINNLAELEQFAKDLLDKISKQKTARSVDGVGRVAVISLVGDLGVGKTTFVQTLAKQLGVKEVVNSPTYTILKKYEIEGNENFKQLVHMDAYRLNSTEELVPLRFEEYLAEPNTLVCIEWADKIKEKLPADIIEISMKIVEGEVREVVVD